MKIYDMIEGVWLKEATKKEKKEEKKKKGEQLELRLQLVENEEKNT